LPTEARHADPHEAPTRLDMLRRFLAERHDPEPYHRGMAERSLRQIPFPLRGSRMLDLGCGPGYYTRALTNAGATVVAIDIDLTELTAAKLPMARAQADALHLPFGDAKLDGVFCTNLLEHTRQPLRVINEIARVVVPGGWTYLAWTNWYSPYGDHDISPFHYLGPERRFRVWRRLFGEPHKNVPLQNLWPTHVGSVLRYIDDHPSLRTQRCPAVLPLPGMDRRHAGPPGARNLELHAAA
jgi:SAM-dependent methyltransferase